MEVSAPLPPNPWGLMDWTDIRIVGGKCHFAGRVLIIPNLMLRYQFPGVRVLSRDQERHYGKLASAKRAGDGGG